MLPVLGRAFWCAAIFGVLSLVPAARAADSPPDVARGEHLASAVAHCTECHGENLGGGRSFAVGTAGAKVVASNLTAGAGGVGGKYGDADYARAIRLGVRPDGSHLAVMPSSDYTVLTDSDVASLIAYIRSATPVDRSPPRLALDPSSSPAPVGAASPAVAAPPPETLPEGAYLARLGGCLSCHGADLHGSKRRSFSAPDISHGGIGTWSAADFTKAMRTGHTPDGRLLAEPMPWHAIGRLTGSELDALYAFLEAAPPATPAR